MGIMVNILGVSMYTFYGNYYVYLCVYSNWWLFMGIYTYFICIFSNGRLFMLIFNKCV